MIDASLSAAFTSLYLLDLEFHPFAKPIRARNSQAGIETLIAALRDRASPRWRSRRSAAIAKAVAALIHADLNVFVVNPRRIKAFHYAEGLIAKTEKLTQA